MMKKTVRMLCTVLLVALLLSAFVSCSQKEQPDNPEQTQNAAGDNTATAPDSGDDTDVTPPAPTVFYDENGYELDDLPADLKYGGVDFTILTWSEWGKQDFMLDETVAWNQTLYERQLAVEDQLGVVLKVKTSRGSWDYRNEFVQLVENDYNTNSASMYDLILDYATTIGDFTVKGWNTNLNDVNYLNFNKPWWNDDQIDAATVNGKLYFLSGDATATTPLSVTCIFGNKQLLTNYGQTDLYSVVYDGAWTIEKLMEVALNNVNFTDEKTGIYGLTLAGSMCGPLMTAAGYKYLSHDSRGLISLAPDLNELKVHNLFSTLQGMICDNDNVINNVNTNLFAQGRAFFHAGQLANMESFVKSNTEFEYIILPLPKYDTDQKDYHTLCGSWNAYYCILKKAQDKNMSGAVLESLGSQGYRLVTPKVFEENLSLKFVSNPVDSEMVHFIYSTLTYDAAHVYGVDSLGNLASAFNSVADPTQSWTGIYSKNIDTWKQKIMILNNNCK